MLLTGNQIVPSGTLTHTLLELSCSNPSIEFPGFNEYTIELCCVTLVVTARKLQSTDEWQIIDVKQTE